MAQREGLQSSRYQSPRVNGTNWKVDKSFIQLFLVVLLIVKVLLVRVLLIKLLSYTICLVVCAGGEGGGGGGDKLPNSLKFHNRVHELKSLKTPGSEIIMLHSGQQGRGWICSSS